LKIDDGHRDKYRCLRDIAKELQDCEICGFIENKVENEYCLNEFST